MKRYIGVYHEEYVCSVTVLIDADSKIDASKLFREYLKENDLSHNLDNDNIRVRPLSTLEVINDKSKTKKKNAAKRTLERKMDDYNHKFNFLNENKKK